MTALLISKAGMQMALRELRKAGFKVEKINGGYVVRDEKGNEKLRAAEGAHDYLLRYERGWLMNYLDNPRMLR